MPCKIFWHVRPSVCCESTEQCHASSSNGKYSLMATSLILSIFSLHCWSCSISLKSIANYSFRPGQWAACTSYKTLWLWLSNFTTILMKSSGRWEYGSHQKEWYQCFTRDWVCASPSVFCKRHIIERISWCTLSNWPESTACILVSLAKMRNNQKDIGLAVNSINIASKLRQEIYRIVYLLLHRWHFLYFLFLIACLSRTASLWHFVLVLPDETLLSCSTWQSLFVSTPIARLSIASP